MAGPHTARTGGRYNHASPRVEPAKINGEGGDRGINGEERCLKRPKELRRPGRRSKLMPRIEGDGGFLWKPYVPRWNDGMLYVCN